MVPQPDPALVHARARVRGHLYPADPGVDAGRHGEDYIRTARAKGLSERRVIFRHSLRAALTPVVTQFGLDVGILLGGAVITESVFALPGLGFTLVEAITQQDLPIVIGVVIVAAAAVIVANIVVDAFYAVLDPRVRLH